jgi:hypothetical protein
MQFSEEELQFFINLIDLGASRGAWKGGELMAVGAMRDNLVKHVKGGDKVDAKETKSKVKG